MFHIFTSAGRNDNFKI